MKKKGYFVKRIFLSFLFLNVLSRFGYFVNTIIDTVSGGNILGEQALSIVSIISPLFYFISFFASLVGPGCATLFAIFVGKFEKEKANRYAGFSLVSSILIGMFCALVLLVIKKPFLYFYEIPSDMYEGASSYYNWYIALALIIPVYFSIYYLTLSDGDAFFTMLGSVGEIIVNAVLSVILCKNMGINGLGLSTFISYVIAMLLNCLRFFSKKNSIKFIPCLRFSMFKKSIKFSLYSALNNIFVVVVHLIINKIIIDSCGDYYLPVYAVISFVLSTFLMFGAIGDSAKPLCSTYFGEKNYQGVKNTVDLSYKTVLIMGLIMIAVFLIFAPFIPMLFGIENMDLINLSKRAIIVVSLSAIPFGMCYFCYQIYASINRPFLGLFATFLFNFSCPLIFSIPFAYTNGIDGISIGTSISAFASIMVFYLFLLVRYKRKGFPLYLKNTNENSFEYDFVLSEETIIEIRDKIVEKLNNEHYETKIIEHLLEELLIKIYEKNNRKQISCECSVFIGANSARVIVRDNGVIFNFTNKDNSSDSINTIMLNNLLDNIKEKDYLVTSSINRNGFVFRK